LKLARDLEANGVPIIGTTPDMIDMARTASASSKLIDRLGLKQPPNRSREPKPRRCASRGRSAIRWWCVRATCSARRAMEIVHEQKDLERYMRRRSRSRTTRRCCSTRFLSDAMEVDVDAVSDGRDVPDRWVMEHIEQAGVHSGDSHARCRRIL